MRTVALVIAMFVALVVLTHSGRAQERAPFHLGHRAMDDLPQLSDDELGTAQQQALLNAMYGDYYTYRASDHACAGCAGLIRKYAIPSNTPHYGSYWVGGGLPIFGDDPLLHEGTFGWDYYGILFTKRIDLNFSHGRRYQGGFGAYKTDGPRHPSK